MRCLRRGPRKLCLLRRRRRAGGLIRKVLLVLIVLAAAGFAYWKIKSNKKENDATTAKTAAAANRAVPVTVAAVASKTMPIFINALGTVTAYNTVTVKSRVDGQLLSVNVREGQQVKQGQVLAMIDPRPYQAAVAQAEGQLAKDQASADYAKAEAGRYTASVSGWRGVERERADAGIERRGERGYAGCGPCGDPGGEGECGIHADHVADQRGGGSAAGGRGEHRACVRTRRGCWW